MEPTPTTPTSCPADMDSISCGDAMMINTVTIDTKNIETKIVGDMMRKSKLESSSDLWDDSLEMFLFGRITPRKASHCQGMIPFLILLQVDDVTM